MRSSEKRPGALSGLVVLDFSRDLAGPLATMLLGDFGATVVKVESPAGGDETRKWGPPFVDGDSAYFLSVNRNKRSIVLDLRDQADLQTARTIACEADVLVENLRPGRMDGFGLGFDRLREDNPGLVYCSVSAFGQQARSELAGYDLVIQAAAGLMSVTGMDHGPPLKAGLPAADILTGLYATVGILTALHERARSGAGQRVSANLFTSLLASMFNSTSSFLNAGILPLPSGNQHPSLVPYQTFEALDGYLVIAAGNERQFGALCKALNLEVLMEDKRFCSNTARVANRHELIELLSNELSSRSVEEWLVELQSQEVPCSRVNNLSEAFALAESLGVESTVEIHGSRTVKNVVNPIELSKSPVGYQLPPPRLGADQGFIQRWLHDLANQSDSTKSDAP